MEMDGGLLRTTGQWIRHNPQRIRRLENLALPPSLATRDRSGARKKFKGWNEMAMKGIAAFGLDQRQIEVLKRYGLLAVDNVTQQFWLGEASVRSKRAK